MRYPSALVVAALAVVRVGSAAADTKVVDTLNTKLHDVAQKDQCPFKEGTEQLEPGCDKKLADLAAAVLDARKALDRAGVSHYTFVVYDHMDSGIEAKHAQELTEKRAAVIVKELVSRGVPKDQLRAIGMGSAKPLVKPDNSPAKRAKNRRYEITIE